MTTAVTRRLLILGAVFLAAAAASMTLTDGIAKTRAQQSASIVLHVDGMHCATCPITVRAVLRRLDGVSDAVVTAADKSAHVTYDPSRVAPSAMVRAVTTAGYPARVR